MERIHQLVVQYACRTTPVEAPGTKTRKDILSKVRSVWSELVDDEVPDDQLEQLRRTNQGLICAYRKSFFLGGITAEASSLLIGRDTLTMTVPRRLAGQDVNSYRRDLWLQRDVNEQARRVVLELQNLLSVGVHRAGKIAEIVFAPVTPEELETFARHLLGGLSELPKNIQGELTFVRQENGREYNFVLRILARPVNLDQPCQVTVKLDVNNRDMSKDLHPDDISKVWGVADQALPGWLFSILGGEV